MKLRQRTNNLSQVQILAGAAIFLLATAVSAQAPPPPPPAPPTDGAPAAAAPADAKAPEAGGIDPVVEREIIDHIVNGKTAVKALDLTTAQMYFEQAFAKCDANQVKGPLLARVYMALGALYAGFLQQVPQGTEFIKMALTNDTSAKPEAELLNETVQSTYDMVRERLGITGPAQVEQGGGGAVGPGGFWVMKHERVTEAKRMFPFGIFIETNPMVAVQAVRLYFRLPSDRNYQGAPMQKNGSMYGLLIGCDAIALIDPQAVYYYIEVIGGDGSVIAHEGTVDSPIEIKMIDEGSFAGTQPNLPGMEEQQKCNPDDAAPCPPWDPHCHDMPCVTSEDCLGGKVCREGYCQGGGGEGGEGYEDDSEMGALGLSVYFGMGMGFGIVGGDDEDPIDENPDGNPIPLASGMSPSWMFTRFGLGYFFNDFIRAGLWMRLQHIKSQSMKVAGPSNDDNNLFPMWGISGTLFYWGKGEWFANGQVLDEDGKLADDQGLRLYAKLEFNFYGAMYHELTLTGANPDPNVDGNKTEERDHASGMQAVGLGPGILYGLHKNFDIGFEIMYDYVGIGTGTWAHNFDASLQLHVHF